MAKAAALAEEVIPLNLDGYAYSGRLVHQPDATSEPILLVGGAFQYQTAWDRLEKGCVRAASVLTVDLPGFGAADALPARYGFDFLTEALEQLLRTVASGRVNILGTSYGAVVALHFARDHPERVARLALVGTTGRLTDKHRDGVEQGIRLAREDRLAEFAQFHLDGLTCSSPDVTVARRKAVQRCFSRALNELSGSDLAKYRENCRRLLSHADLVSVPEAEFPVLVTTGEHDPLSPPALAREVAARFADARFTALRNADHLVHIECPAQLVDLLTRFFTAQSLAGLDYCHPVEHFRTGTSRTPPAPRPEAAAPSGSR